MGIDQKGTPEFQITVLLSIYRHRVPSDIDVAVMTGFWQFFAMYGEH